MSDLPYTDADLRTEAARYTGDDMDGLEIITAMADRAPWNKLDTAAFNTAYSQVIQYAENAADVSDWAVNLGADGLTPDRHIVYRDDQDRAFAAIHFAFDPDAVNVEEVREALTEAIRRGLGYKPA